MLSPINWIFLRFNDQLKHFIKTWLLLIIQWRKDLLDTCKQFCQFFTELSRSCTSRTMLLFSLPLALLPSFVLSVNSFLIYPISPHSDLKELKTFTPELVAKIDNEPASKPLSPLSTLNPEPYQTLAFHSTRLTSGTRGSWGPSGPTRRPWIWWDRPSGGTWTSWRSWSWSERRPSRRMPS